MHARLFDVFHDAANQYGFTVADGIHVHFYRVIQEAIQKHRRIVGHANSGHKVAA